MNALKLFSADAEMSLIGCSILDQSVGLEICSKVKPNDFYVPLNRSIYEIVQGSILENKKPDLVWIAEKYRTIHGGDISAELAKIVEVTPNTLSYKSYLDIVLTYSKQRKLEAAVNRIRCYLSAHELDADGAIEFAQKEILNLETSQNPEADVKQMFDKAVEKAELVSSGEYVPEGVSTGFQSLDNCLGLLQPAGLYIIAGRTSMGKTTLALNMMTEMLLADKRVMFVSLEMPLHTIAERVICIAAGVSPESLVHYMSETDLKYYKKYAKIIKEKHLYLSGIENHNINTLRINSRKMQATNKIDIIIVDYLQLMTAGGNTENRVTEVGMISRGLKQLAMELNIPVIALAQVNRSPTKTEDKRPKLTDLRESGSIENDADAVIFIHQDSYYSFNQQDTACELIVAKNRNGPTGKIDVLFDRRLSRFDDIPLDNKYSNG